MNKLILIFFFIGLFSFALTAQDSLSFETRAKIFKQIIDSTEFNFDDSAKYFLAYDSKGISGFQEDDFFIDFVKKNELLMAESYSKLGENEIGVSLALNLNQSSIISTCYFASYDDNTGESTFIENPEIYYFKLDSNYNLIKKPSQNYFTLNEKKDIYQSILKGINTKLDTSYFQIQSIGIDFSEFENEDFVKYFLSNNNFQNTDKSIYLELIFYNDRNLFEITPTSYYDDLLTGERTFSQYTFDNFFFELTEDYQAIKIPKEEAYKRFRSEN